MKPLAKNLDERYKSARELYENSDGFTENMAQKATVWQRREAHACDVSGRRSGSTFG